MMYVAIMLLIITSVLVGVIVLITVAFSRALQRALDHAERTHERQVKLLNTSLDRLMAQDFAMFKAWQSTETGPPGEIIEADETQEALLREEPFIDHVATAFGERPREGLLRLIPPRFGGDDEEEEERVTFK